MRERVQKAFILKLEHQQVASFIMGNRFQHVRVCVCVQKQLFNIPYQRMVWARKLNTADGYCDQFAKTDSAKLERSFKCSVRKSLCAHFIHTHTHLKGQQHINRYAIELHNTYDKQQIYIYTEEKEPEQPAIERVRSSTSVKSLTLCAKGNLLTMFQL